MREFRRRIITDRARAKIDKIAANDAALRRFQTTSIGKVQRIAKVEIRGRIPEDLLLINPVSALLVYIAGIGARFAQ